jgi:dipeptidyl-peptidase 4
MIRTRRHVLTAWVVLYAAASGAAAQTAVQAAAPSHLTVERIFGGREFRTETVGPARWLGDGAAYTALEPAPGGLGTDLVRYDTPKGTREVLVSAAQLTPPGGAPLDVEDYEWSADQRRLLVFTESRQVWRQNTRGDYWVLDRETGALRRLGAFARPSTLMFAKFAPDGGRVAYVVENDLYVEDLDTGGVTRLTHDGSRSIINGTFDWVYEEELGLRDGFRWSPDGARIAYWQLDASGVRDFFLLHTTNSLYACAEPLQYPKAGETNSAGRIGVVPAAGGPTVWLQVDGDPRNQYLARMDWAASSEELVVQRLNRRQNRLDLLLAEARTGAVRPILTERDSAWVEVVDDLVWLDRGRRFTWVSERDGWNRVYVVSRDGADLRVVTPEAVDVIRVTGVDVRGGWVYYLASPDTPTQRYLWRARLDGGGRTERLTPVDLPGTHGYTPSPDLRWAFHTHSRFGVPPTTDLVRLPDHRTLRVLAENAALRQRVAALEAGPVEFLRVPGADGTPLDAWIMKPPGFDPARRYPILFYVYGGPAAQTVTDAWGGARYLYHLMLTQKGYLVASVDNRGAPAPRGRAFRKAIYGQLWVLETRDQTAAARTLARLPYVDSTRVGVWGWSNGGFMSLNLLFQSPGLYGTGIAVAPVTHWKFYDTIYTERYNGLPQENPDGYERGSPITYAARLRGNLLVVHGSGDDNVHYQNTAALVNALVDANKPFTMMEYPGRNHAIAGGATSMHLYGLMERYLDEHLMGRTAPHAVRAEP